MGVINAMRLYVDLITLAFESKHVKGIFESLYWFTSSFYAHFSVELVFNVYKRT